MVARSTFPDSKLRRWCALLLLFSLNVAVGLAASEPVTVVDVMVLYTAQARAAAGGTNNISAKIDLAMSEANLVFQNSRANLRVRLAHRAEVNYVESGSIRTDLERLRTPNDGLLEEAHALRAQHAADLVCLITERGSDFAFYALQGPSTSNAFSVIRRRHLTGDYYFPVVLGFNFGCQLERPYADSVGAFPFSYGYTAETDFDWFSSVEAFDGNRLPYFSNPDLVLGGVGDVPLFRLGIPEGRPGAANNVKTLNYTAPIVAAFLGSAPRTLPPTVMIVGATGTATNPVEVVARTNLTLRAVAGDPDGFVARVDFFLRSIDGTERRSLGFASGDPFTLVWSNVPEGDHVISAQATDNLGAVTRATEELVVHAAFVPPGNDHFSNRVVIAGAEVSIVGDNDGASVEDDEVAWNGASVWYSWTAPADGRVTLTVPETTLQSSFGVFTGAVVSSLTHIANNGASGGRDPSIDFEVGEGATFHVSVQGSFGEPSSFTLRLQFHQGPRVRIVRPSAGAQFRTGAAIDIEAEASPASGAALARVELFVDNLLLATRTNAPFTAIWENVPVGNHTLTSAAYDSDGESGMSLPITIRVAPSNDDFTSSFVISGRETLVTGKTQGASLEAGEPEHGGVPVWNSVWWSWTAPASGTARVATASAYFWQALGIYTGPTLTNLTVVASNHATLGYSAIVEFAAVAGTPYHFAVGAVAEGPESGDFTLSLALAAPPSNDNFADASPLNGSSFVVTGNTALATKELGEPNHAGNPGGHSAWWRWSAPETANAELSVTASGFTPLVAVYSGDGINWLARQAAATNRPVQFRSVAGAVYYFAVDGVNGSGGECRLQLRLQTPPSNDDFTNAIPLTGFSLVITGANVGASLERREPAHGDLPGGRSVWWSWTAPADGWLEIDPRHTTSFERIVAVYTGSELTNLTRVAASSTTFFTVFGLNARSGVTYHIAVAGVDRGDGALSGDIELRLNETPVPSNDNFANRIAVTGTNFTLPATNLVATREPGEPLHGANGSHSFWWSWTAPASGRATVWAFSWTLDTLAAVYQGDSLGSLTPVGTRSYYWNFRFGGHHTAGITFTAVAGTTYQIAADSLGPVGDTIALVLNFSPPLPNDSFAGRRVLVGTNIEFQTSNLGATLQSGEPAHAGSVAARSVWYSWTAPASGRLRVGVWGSFVPLRCAAYTGNTLASLTGVASAASSPFTPEAAINSLSVQAGQTYQIVVDDVEQVYWPLEGFFTFGLTFSPQPANDDFEHAAVLSGTSATATGTTVAATRQSGEPPHLSGLASLWWDWTPPGDGTGILDASTSAVPVTLTIYTGSNLTNLTRLAGGGARVLFAAERGVTYHVAVEQAQPDDGGEVTFTALLSHLKLTNPTNSAVFHQPIDLLLAGERAPADGSFPQMDILANGSRLGIATEPWFTFVWSNAPLGHYSIALRATNTDGWVHESLPIALAIRPANDDFAARLSLPSQADVQVYGSAFAATEETAEPQTGKGTVWYTWTAPSTVRSQVYAAGPAGPKIRVLVGAALGELVEATPGPASELWFDAHEGQSYQLVVLAPATSAEQFFLHLRHYPRPTNDNFAARIVLPGEANVSLYALALAATEEPNEPPTGLGSVWYSWTAPFTGWALVNVEAWFGPQARVFQGAALGQLTEVAPGPASGVSFRAQAGQSYEIAALAPPNLPDQFLLHVNLYPPPSNNLFAARAPLIGTSHYANGSLLAADHEPDEPLHAGSPGHGSIWWSWTAPLSGLARVFVETSGWAPLLASYSGNALASLQPVGAAAAHTLTFRVSAGATYAIALDGDATVNGDFGLWLTVAPSPANDDFAARLPLPEVADLQIYGTAHLASEEMNEPPTGLGSVWYSWTAPFTGRAQVKISGWFGPQARVFRGVAPGQLTELASGPAAELWFDAEAGQSYAISALAPPNLPDQFLLEIHLSPVPANDLFASRASLSGFSATTSGSLLYAAREPGEPVHAGHSGGRSLWWTWTAPGSGTVALTLNTEQFSPLLGVYSGTSVSNLSVVASAAAPTLNFSTQTGAVYQIALDTDGGGDGTFTLNLKWTGALADYHNDHFTNRAELTGRSAFIHADNSGATVELAEQLPGGASGKTLWWTWTPPERGRVTASIAPIVTPVIAESLFQPSSVIIIGPHPPRPPPPPPPIPPVPAPGSETGSLLGVWRGEAPGELTLVASNNFYSGAPAGWRVLNQASFPVTTGEPLQLSVDGCNGSSGPFTVEWLFSPAPTYDDFETRFALAGDRADVRASNIAASREAGEPAHGGDPGGASVWWEWHAPASGVARVAVEGLDAVLGIYTGDALGNLVEVTGGPGSVAFKVVAGTAYQIAIDGSGGAEGEFRWTLSLALPPPNDSFANRIPLAGLPYATNGTVLAATRETAEPGTGVNPSGGTVWYSWRAPVSGTVTVTVNDWLDVNIYAGASLDRLLEIEGGGSQRSFYAAAGVVYAIAVDDYDGLAADFHLDLSGPPMPPALDASATPWEGEGGFRLRVVGVNGQSLIVQASSDLVNWTALVIDTLQGDYVEFLDRDAALWSQRFYRVLPLEALFSPAGLRVAADTSVVGRFGIQIFGAAGQPVALEASSDLEAWEDLYRGIVVGDGIRFFDPVVPGVAHRFYRATPVR